MACFPSLPSLCKWSSKHELSSPATLPSLGLSPVAPAAPQEQREGKLEAREWPSSSPGLLSFAHLSSLPPHLLKWTEIVLCTRAIPYQLTLLSCSGTPELVALAFTFSPPSLLHVSALHPHSALSPAHARGFKLLPFHPLNSRSFFPNCSAFSQPAHPDWDPVGGTCFLKAVRS